MSKLNIDFTLIDESVLQYGFRILMNGYQPKLFASNPVMLLMHNRAEGSVFASPTNDVILPIGRWNNIRIDGTALKAQPEFDDNDEFAVKVENKVNKGYLNGASISLIPIEVSEDASLKLPGQIGPTVTKWEIMEASIVDIPNCKNALAIRNAAGKSILLSSADSSKKDEVLEGLKKLAAPVEHIDPRDNNSETHDTKRAFNNQRAELNEEPRSPRVQHLMTKHFKDLYKSGELQELRELHPKAFFEKYKEGTGKEHPDKKKIIGEQLEIEDEEEQPYTDKVQSLMQQSYRDLYMNGGLVELEKLNKHAFYKKFKEGIGKDHPDSKEAKQAAKDKADGKSKSINDKHKEEVENEKRKSSSEYKNNEVSKLMAKKWVDLWRSGESESLYKLDETAFFRKFKEGNGVEHPLNKKLTK